MRMVDLFLFGPILFVVAFGWVASSLSLRSSRRYRDSLQQASRQPGRRSADVGPAE